MVVVDHRKLASAIEEGLREKGLDMWDVDEISDLVVALDGETHMWHSKMRDRVHGS